jgi:DnaA family protein
MVKQQTLPLKVPQEKSFSNFLIGSNQGLLEQLKALTATSAIYLWGERSSGCSHLLQASCNYWRQHDWYTLYLDLAQTDSLDILLSGALEGIQLLALDHVSAFIGNSVQEECLFHLFNRGVQSPFAMLWAAPAPPQLLNCQLADLQSRLSAAMIFQVQNLKDAEIKMLLQQYAKQRGFILEPTLIEFLLNHYPRDLNQLLPLLDQLDEMSLQTQRRLTVPLLKKLNNDRA